MVHTGNGSVMRMTAQMSQKIAVSSVATITDMNLWPQKTMTKHEY